MGQPVNPKLIYIMVKYHLIAQFDDMGSNILTFCMTRYKNIVSRAVVRNLFKQNLLTDQLYDLYGKGIIKIEHIILEY